MARLQDWKTLPKCSFCGKTRDRVAKIVAGPNAWICNECVALCVDIIDMETEGAAAAGEQEEPAADATSPRTSENRADDAKARSPMRLVLASGSASRFRILRDAGFDPDVVVSGVDEGYGGLTPAEAVVLLAERKALAVADRCRGCLVIGCDSMLEIDGEALGKPASSTEVTAMWRRLSGRQGILHTGHCLIDTSRDRRSNRLASSLVRFGVPTERELAAYAATDEPLALAGAFSIEGLSGPFVEAVQGSPSTVLGLSLPVFREMLAELRVAITDLWREDRL